MKTVKFAFLCAAVLALVACEPKPVGNLCDVCGEDPCVCEDEEPAFVSKVNVADGTLAEWDNLPAEYVASCVHNENATMDGLLSAKVYADQLYINVLVEINPEVITDKSWTPLHIYINTDNSAETGGFSDQWTDADADILLETACFASDAANNYDPGVFKWWGEVGGAGWAWTEHWEVQDYYTDGDGLNWGAIIPEATAQIGASQLVGNTFEIQLMRELIPATWSEEGFTIAFDIQQNWNTVGMLPNAADDDMGATVLAEKLAVTIDWAE